MGERERRVRDELQRLDPRLADLYEKAFGYIVRLDEPSSIHMLSHAAREISNAVLRILSGEGEPLTEAEEEPIKSDESQRRTISRALELPVHHPSVSAWLRAHRAFQRTTHVGGVPPSSDAIEKAVRGFRTLTDLLVGRIGLYFDARAEVDELLEVEEPTDEDIERLQALVGRPQLRRAFFRDLRHPGWLEPLRQAGLFDDIPDVIADPESGELSAPDWPEGDYLTAMASDRSGETVEILLGIPDEISNPIAWRSVADAALQLPAQEAVHLVPKLRAGLDQTNHPMVSRAVLEVAEKLSKAGERGALELLRGLLSVVPERETSELSTSGTGKVATLPGLSHAVRASAVLDVVEQTARVERRAVVAELSNILDRMLRIEYGDPDEVEAPVTDYSIHWYRLDEETEDRSPKSMIADAILRAARALVETAEDEREYVLWRLAKYPWSSFRRLKYEFLSRNPVFDQQALDGAVGDSDQMTRSRVLPEYGRLVQAHFDDASPEIREAVIERILEGPPAETVARSIGDDEEDPEEEKQRFREQWQRHRLRMFGDNFPPELEDLAAELGTLDESLTKHDRDLDEYGFAIRTGIAGGPSSPLTQDEVQTMSPKEFIDYLQEWVPQAGWDSPTPAGLAGMIANQVQGDFAWAEDFLGQIREADVDPTYLRGAVDGLAAALKANRSVPWDEALALVRRVVSEGPEPTPEDSPARYFDQSDPGFLWARAAAADFLADCASSDSVPVEFANALWGAVSALLRSAATWNGAEEGPDSMNGVLQLELNQLGGKAAEALLSVALYDYRAWKEAGTDGELWPRRGLLGELLELVLKQTGEAGVAARSVVGRYLPFLVQYDRQWVEENWDCLFDGAVEEPFSNPTFASYVVRGGLHRETFALLRPLYESAARACGEETSVWTSGGENFRPGRHLLMQLVNAYRRGWLDLDADKDLLDTAFANANSEDVAHAWWAVFRYWEDASDVPAEDIERVVALWRRRLARMEASLNDTRHSGEAKGMGWLAMSERVADEQVVSLLHRVVKLSNGEVPISGALWERLARMAAIDTRRAVETAVLMIEADLASDFPHFNFAEVAPVLRSGLAADDPEIVQFAERAIHKLGDSGFEQFGGLLGE